MNAFLYYMRRIDCLEQHAAVDFTQFVEYALFELEDDIETALRKEFITNYQYELLLGRLGETVF